MISQAGQCALSHALILLLLCATAHGQSASLPTVPRFDLPESGLEWKQPVHALKFFDVTGHRAGVFGRQTGSYEAWIYPIKILHGFRLEFRQDGMPEPVRGENFLEEIVARPESTTLVYVHPRFTVRQIIWTPLDQPAIVNFFDVDSGKPLTITAKFVPDFKPMWPASLGGQYTYWNEDEMAFGITDATSKPTALVGSPTVATFTEHMDHSMVGGEMLLQLRVEPATAQKTFPAVVMALHMESPRDARATYRNVLSRARSLYQERVGYHKEFLARTLTIETPDEELNRAFTWAKVAIDAGWVCTPTKHTEGCGLVAGFGPAGEYERPGFAWWFGGDALMASWAMLDYGDAPGALQVLRFLKGQQRADGKMLHELTQSVDLVDWLGKYGFAYYHADTTPMYIYSVGEYWRRTADRKFLEEFFPSVKRAYEYCISTTDPAEGLMDNTKAGLAAVEVGPLRGKVTKDIYLQGFWLGALQAIQDLAGAVNDAKLQEESKQILAKARQTLHDRWWNPEGKYFAFGVNTEGKRVDMHGNWPAVLHALNSFEDRTDLNRAVDRFLPPEILTDWGTRWLSNKDSLYDPLSYNNGSVWPFMNGFVAWALYARSQPLGGYTVWSSSARLTGMLSPGAIPELINGDFFRAGERAVPHQLFSSVGVILPAARGLMGLKFEPQKEQGARRILSLSPSLPAHWPFLRFAGQTGEGRRLKAEILQSKGRWAMSLEHDGTEPLEIRLTAPLPFDAHIRRVWVDGKPVEHGQLDLRVTRTVPRKLEVTVEYEGGVSIIPPENRPEPGSRTSSLKLLRSIQVSEGKRKGLDVTVAGLGGRTYTLDLMTTVSNLTAEGATVQKTSNGYRLEIHFDGLESDYVTRQIPLRW